MVDSDVKWSVRSHPVKANCHLIRLEATLEDGSIFVDEQTGSDLDAAFNETLRSRMLSSLRRAGSQVRLKQAKERAALAENRTPPPRAPFPRVEAGQSRAALRGPTRGKPGNPDLGEAKQIRHGGRRYVVTPADALALFGALALAVDGETASITLASGDVLELTHQDVSDIGRQLAGKPADEVSG